MTEAVVAAAVAEAAPSKMAATVASDRLVRASGGRISLEGGSSHGAWDQGEVTAADSTRGGGGAGVRYQEAGAGTGWIGIPKRGR